MKRFFWLFLSAWFVMAPVSSFAESTDADVLYQNSTIQALSRGLYDGEISCRELKEHGNMGTGTFSALDGEMICVDNVFYQIKSDGKAYTASLDMLTPFAAVVFFSPDSRVDMVGMDSYDALKDFLDANIPTQNDFYAIKITGTFKYVKTRSVPKQEKPYPLLSTITATQPEFEFTEIKGTMVGFRFPGYMKGVNVAGYHFHFLDEAKTVGGHVLECQIDEAAAEIDGKSKFFMQLPRSNEFMSLDLSGDEQINIDKAEK